MLNSEFWMTNQTLHPSAMGSIRYVKGVGKGDPGGAAQRCIPSYDNLQVGKIESKLLMVTRTLI